MNLEQRTEAQLLQDFEGPLVPSLKTLNLIYSLYRALENVTPAPLTDLTSAGGTIVIPRGATLAEAFQILLDAVDP